MRFVKQLCALVCTTICVSGVALAQQPQIPAGAGARPGGIPGAAGGGDIKPYKEVITEKVKTDSGLIIVHRLDEKVYFEIPKKLLEKDILLVSRIAKTPQVGFGPGIENNTEVIRFERKYNRILLRTISYVNIAADSLPIYRAVRDANFDEVIGSYSIMAFGKDSNSFVFDATPLFTSDVGIMTIGQGERQQYRITALDPSRTFIEFAKSFPNNVEVENVLTYGAENAPQNRTSRTMSFTLHHSFVLLPEKPMMPRYADNRVGFFGLRKVDYSSTEQKAKTRQYVLRWRLEPKDPAAYKRGELVEPIKPITWYIDPATPIQWRKYIKQGVEDWKVAFEKIGFKNAIIALDPPTNDPDFDPEDTRYSVIRYMPTTIQNAVGPNVHDPRSGEIIESDIYWFHNIMTLQTNWYFAQAVSDPLSHKIPFPDSLMGRLIRFVCAHEVGHTLGFPHNMGASSSYPVDSLRSKTFTEKMGTAPSIMDYARFNYVAQPGDNAAMLPNIGVYDEWAVKWGYSAFPDAKTPEEVHATLVKWTNEAAKNPYLRYGAQQFTVTDPTSQTEDLGDDPVKATTYGMKNLERAVEYVRTATAKEGEDYAQLADVFVNGIFFQWRLENGHVANVPGGVRIEQKINGQEGVIYTPIAKAKQKEAVKYLVENTFTVPKMFLKEDIVRLINDQGWIKTLQDAQKGFLNTSLSNDKLLRLLEHQTMSKDAYTVVELYNDLESGLFTELKGAKVSVDQFRRYLQRGFVEILATKLVPPPAPVLPPGIDPQFARIFATPDVSKTDIRGITRLQLEGLKSKVSTAVAKASDIETRAHLKDLAVTIDDILNPKK